MNVFQARGLCMHRWGEIPDFPRPLGVGVLSAMPAQGLRRLLHG
jgi:hypothetical protein